MGDRQYSFPAALVRELLEYGLALPDLRDEIFMQIMKQLEENPNPGSIDEGWCLFNICLDAWPPSDTFENYVEIFLRQNNQERLIEILHERVFLGQTDELPSIKEIQRRREEGFASITILRKRSCVSR